MLLRKFILLATTLTCVKADLTCLAWGLVVTLVGLFCHIAPENFHAAEKAILDGVESSVKEAVEAGGDLLKFDISHNPLSIGFKYADLAIHHSTGDANHYLTQIKDDFMDVGIGIAKGTIDQAVQVYDMANWNDVSICLVRGGVKLAKEATPTARLRRRGLSVDGALAVVKDCTSDKVSKILHPARFNITNDNQAVGRTISEVAGLFVPVGAEAAAGKLAVKGEVDLAVYGSEESTRIGKLVDRPGAQIAHFSNEQEAQAVAESLEDPTWQKANCGRCLPLLGGIRSLPGLIPRRRRIARSGTPASFCCRVPQNADVATERVSDDDYVPDLESTDLKDVPPTQSQAIYDPSQPIKYIPEADLVVIPAPIRRDIENGGAEAAAALKEDLSALDVGVISFSKATKRAMEAMKVKTSKVFFQLLRNSFVAGKGDPLYDAMRVMQKDGTDRLVAASFNFQPDSEIVKPLRAFADAALEDGKAAIASLKPEKWAVDRLQGHVEFFWVPPSEKANVGVDVRGLHFDGGVMQFAAADTEGLVVQSSVTQKASRMPVMEDSWTCMKASTYSIVTGESVTMHAVYGAKMAQEGRVSVVMSIAPMYLDDAYP